MPDKWNETCTSLENAFISQELVEVGLAGRPAGRDLLFFKDLFVLHLDFPDVTTVINYFVHWLGLNGVFRLNTWHQHLYDGSSQFVLDGSIANWLYYRDDEPHISYIYYISRKEADLGVLYLRNHFGDAVAVFVRFISHCKMKKKCLGKVVAITTYGSIAKMAPPPHMK